MISNELKTSNYSTDNTSNTNGSNDADEQLFFVEELNDDLIRKFSNEQLKPYFKQVYADLLLRSTSGKDNRGQPSIDKVTLVEFINLPGILSDRFYSQMGTTGPRDAKADGRVI